MYVLEREGVCGLYISPKTSSKAIKGEEKGITDFRGFGESLWYHEYGEIMVKNSMVSCIKNILWMVYGLCEVVFWDVYSKVGLEIVSFLGLIGHSRWFQLVSNRIMIDCEIKMLVDECI